MHRKRLAHLDILIKWIDSLCLKIMHNETRLTDVLSLILMQITLHLNKDIQSTFEGSKVKDSS